MNTYSFDAVRSAAISYFDGDELAGSVWASKYALQNEKGEYLELTPTDMHQRLAGEFARIEAKYKNPMSKDEIFNLLSSFDPISGRRGMGPIVPQGSPMSGIGNHHKIQSLSNCFVIDSPYDAYSGILMTDQEQAQIMKRRGGVGFDISTIRPKGVTTSNAAGTTDGIGIFMERFSNTCREVGQGGRRGALMLTLWCTHPEVETFIDIKRDLKKVTGANISVKMTDEFMLAVKNDEEFTLRWPVTSSLEDAKVTKVVRAKDVWNKLMEAAWTSAEPGVLFWDTVTRETPADIYADKGFSSVSTNPCGEICLAPYDACRLILVDTTHYVLDPFTKNVMFDFASFFRDSRKAQRLMDDLIDLEIEMIDKILKKIESDPEPEHVKRIELDLWKKIRAMNLNGRRTGLGLTGLGDTIAMCNVKYGSTASIQLVGEIYSTLAAAAHTESVEMADERGAFPICDPARHRLPHPFFDRLKEHVEPHVWEKFLTIGRRNIALTTTAPAGSVSCLTQTSSGSEPVFRLSYTRRKKINQNDTNAIVDFTDAMGDKWQHFTVYHHNLQLWMNVTGETDITKSPYWQATSADIDWVSKVEMQGIAQSFIEHAISNTTNLPKETPVDIVNQIYMKGWEVGCKGITIYRDGCRDGVLIETTEEKLPELSASGRPNHIVDSQAPSRPKALNCDIHHATIKGEKYVVIVGLFEGRPYEVFAGLSQHVEVPKKIKQGKLIKNGKNDEGLSTYNLAIPVGPEGDDDSIVFKDVVSMFDNPLYGSISRTISLALRHGVQLEHLCEQLKKDKHTDITSFASVIARVLSKNYVSDGAVTGQRCLSTKIDGTICVSTDLARVQGCLTCMECGNSKC